VIKDLIYKYGKKDSDMERIIFEMFYNRVYFTAYYIIKDRDLAQDILQETFVKAFEKIHTVRDGEKLGAWLAAISTRTSIDYLRKLKRCNEIAVKEEVLSSNSITDVNNITTLESIVERKFIGEVLLKEIDSLTAEHKEVILLYYYADMTYEEIAVATEMKIDTVKTRIYRAKIKLKKSLEKKPDVMGLVIDAKA